MELRGNPFPAGIDRRGVVTAITLSVEIAVLVFLVIFVVARLG
jgi:hypothetical protein